MIDGLTVAACALLIPLSVFVVVLGLCNKDYLLVAQYSLMVVFAVGILRSAWMGE